MSTLISAYIPFCEEFSNQKVTYGPKNGFCGYIHLFGGEFGCAGIYIASTLDTSLYAFYLETFAAE